MQPNVAEIVDEYMKKCKEEETARNKKKIDIIEIHLKTLDDLVNVNSLFTIAVFVGLSMAIPGQRSLENRAECNAGSWVAKRLIVYEVVAFACFLLSSLVAKVLKLHLNMLRSELNKPYFDVKDFMLTLSAISSVAGVVLLTLSVVDVVQIRIGKLSCGSVAAIVGSVLLCIIVGVGLLIYAGSMFFAIRASYRSDIPKDNAENGNGKIDI